MSEQASGAGNSSAAHPVDVLIVTASVESLEAVMAIEAPGTPWVERWTAQGLGYFEREVEGENGVRLRWAAARLNTEMGHASKGKQWKSLESLDPAQVVFCGGCLAKQLASASLGDIVVADYVFANESPFGVSLNAVPLLLDWGADLVRYYTEEFQSQSALVQDHDARKPMAPPLRVRIAQVADVEANLLQHLLAPNMDVAASLARQSSHRVFAVFGIRAWMGQEEKSDPEIWAFARKVSATFATSFLRRFAIPRAEFKKRHRALRLQSLHISGLRNIEDLTLDFSKPSSLKGSWTCIAGINGAGKSSVLQAIALVLLGEAYAAELGQELLKRARRRTEDDNKIKIMNASIEAEVQSEGRVTPLQLLIDEEGAHAPSESPSLRKFWADRAKTHLLLAYGPGRNLSEYLDSRHESKRMQVRRIVTLFDPLAQVASADAILGHKEHDSSVLELLTTLVEDVFQDFELSIVEYQKGLRFQMGGTMLSAVDLPDGFRSTLAWMADLCAGWAEMAPDVAKDGDPSTIQALVLIDEIDLHLHPKLQRVLVPRLRDALPLVQWVVTTHSPLVISSFDSNEIMMLKWDPETGVTRRELDRQVLGFSADEVYKWLMDTEPSSAEIEKIPLNGSPSQRERLAALLGMSPEFSAKDVEENKAFLERQLQEVPQARSADSEEVEGVGSAVKS